jgi:asparagine synthase (glutamine-hydrolysing)
MCGVFGALSLDGHTLEACEALERMALALRHRGPDGARILASPRLALGTTRLAIVDLDARANPPLVSADAQRWLACNGEIYNAEALRRRFPRYPYRCRSDLEPLLPLLAELGPQGIREIDGMFALAAWEPRRETLLLARDRAGEKPLFYTEIGQELWFASELAPLLELTGVSREIDPIALSEFLELGYVLEPRSLFAAIRRVEAGTALVVRGAHRSVVRYWTPQSYADQAAPTGRAAARDRVEQLRDLLRASVRKQVVADVPVGTFLSGGLDSSLITVLAADALGPKRVTAFSARFSAQSYDESDWARRCARWAGVPHVEVDCGEEALRAAFGKIGALSAEPISDPAVLPTFLLAEAARRSVRVVLSGEGADELFGGYPTYLGHALARGYRHMPHFVRRGLERALARASTSRRKVTVEFLLRRFLAEIDLDWVERHLAWFGCAVPGPARLALRDAWRLPLMAQYGHRRPVGGAMLLDYSTALKEKLLVKSDRATMLNSIEARAPFLDWRLTAFALAVPDREKLRGLATKRILKRAAEPLLPRAIVRRRKRGLSVPVAALINGALRAEVDRWLDAGRVRAHGLLDAEEVARRLAEHRAGAANHARTLWPAIVLESWAERWKPVLADRAAAAPYESPASARESLVAAGEP